MDSRVGGAFTSATLDALTALVDNVNALSAVQANNAETFSTLKDMQDEVHRLQKRHDELTNELRAIRKRESTSLRARAAAVDEEQVASSAEAAGAPSGETLAKLGKAVEASVQARADEDALAAYRLAGKSVFPVDDNKIGIRFETFHEGAFFESFFVILALDAETGAPSVFRHTLPHFLPLGSLADKYLDANMAIFIEKVSDLLHAYVVRREHVKALQALHGDAVDSVATTLAFDVIQFTGAVPGTDDAPAQFLLRYEDLAEDLPTRVTVSLTNSRKRRAELAGEDEAVLRKRLKPLEAPFLTTPLPEAYAFILSGR